MLAILDARLSADGSGDREQWCIDNWAAVCAEIGAAQQVTSGTASNQLLVATALRDRLPRVAAVFADGRVSYRLVSTMVWRTALIKDPDAVRAVDSALASALRGVGADVGSQDGGGDRLLGGQVGSACAAPQSTPGPLAGRADRHR